VTTCPVSFFLCGFLAPTAAYHGRASRSKRRDSGSALSPATRCTVCTAPLHDAGAADLEASRSGRSLIATRLGAHPPHRRGTTRRATAMGTRTAARTACITTRAVAGPRAPNPVAATPGAPRRALRRRPPRGADPCVRPRPGRRGAAREHHARQRAVPMWPPTAGARTAGKPAGHPQRGWPPPPRAAVPAAAAPPLRPVAGARAAAARRRPPPVRHRPRRPHDAAARATARGRGRVAGGRALENPRAATLAGAGGGGGGGWGSPPPPSPQPQTRLERGARRPAWLVICGRSARLWAAAASGSAVAAGLAGVPRPHALVGPPTRAGCWQSRMVAVKVDLPTPSGLLPGLARLALTAVLPKIPHCNSSKSVPNRPLRGHRGRFGTRLQQLECGVFGRTAVYPHRRLGGVLRPLTRATPAHIYRACPKRSSTRRPADAPRAAPVLPLCPHCPPAVPSRHDIAALAAPVHVNRHRDGRPAARPRLPTRRRLPPPPDRVSVHRGERPPRPPGSCIRASNINAGVYQRGQSGTAELAEGHARASSTVAKLRCG